MTHFVIQTDGEHGVLLVDGEQPELFGRLVGVDVRRTASLEPIQANLNPYAIPRVSETVVEVTLRLPIGPGNTLTVIQGNKIEDVQGPTADYEPSEATAVPREGKPPWLAKPPLIPGT